MGKGESLLRTFSTSSQCLSSFLSLFAQFHSLRSFPLQSPVHPLESSDGVDHAGGQHLWDVARRLYGHIIASWATLTTTILHHALERLSWRAMFRVLSAAELEHGRCSIQRGPRTGKEGKLVLNYPALQQVKVDRQSSRILSGERTAAPFNALRRVARGTIQANHEMLLNVHIPQAVAKVGTPRCHSLHSCSFRFLGFNTSKPPFLQIFWDCDTSNPSLTQRILPYTLVATRYGRRPSRALVRYIQDLQSRHRFLRPVARRRG